MRKSLSVQLTKPAPCQHKLKINVAPEGVQPVRNSVVQEFQKEALIAGFRKGKAPRELVEKKYPEEIREQTVRRLTQQVFEQVTEEHQLKPVSPFAVTKLEFDEAKGLDVEAEVEVEPEFKLAEYKGIKLAKEATVVKPEDVDQALAKLQESAAQLVPTGQGEAKERKLPNLDNDFAKEIGFETLDELRAHLEAKLREQKTAGQKQALEQALCEELLKRHQFEVPPKLVEHQADRLQRDFSMRLLMSGRTEEQAKEELGKYAEQLKTNAARLVKLSFILDRVAQAEKLTITQDEMVDRLWQLAKRWGKDPGEVRKILDAQGLWSSVLSSIRQDKTVNFLLSAAQVEEPRSAAS